MQVYICAASCFGGGEHNFKHISIRIAQQQHKSFLLKTEISLCDLHSFLQRGFAAFPVEAVSLVHFYLRIWFSIISKQIIILFIYLFTFVWQKNRV